jgi:hypothetical protein
MSKCRDCRGNGECLDCKGTGSWKKKDTHPSSGLVDPSTGDVKCAVCMGKRYCQTCKGSGET